MLVVRSEKDADSILLETALSMQDIYQLQQGKLFIYRYIENSTQR